MNLKRCVNLVKHGNPYKGYKALDTTGIADIKDPTCMDMLLSKFDKGLDKQDKHNVQSNGFVLNESIVNNAIKALDPTSSGGTDHLSCRIIQQLWNLRDNNNAEKPNY